ncbi:MAG: DUF5666 domain-containing protein [Patescibacteria group bacterium]
MNKKLIIMTLVALSALPVMYGASANESKVRLGADVSLQAKMHDRDDHGDTMKHFKDKMRGFLRLGTVTKVNTDGSFTVESKNGKKEMTVKTDTSTSYTKNGQATDKSVIAVGALVNVKGALDKATKTINAKAVNVIDKIKGVHFKGVITAISGSILTVKAENGTVYTIDQGKAHILHSFWFGTSSDIKVGDTVGVWGTQVEGSSTITARLIKDWSPKPTPSPTPTATP